MVLPDRTTPSPPDAPDAPFIRYRPDQINKNMEDLTEGIKFNKMRPDKVDPKSLSTLIENLLDLQQR